MLFSDLDFDNSPSTVPCSSYQGEDDNNKDELISLCNKILKVMNKDIDTEFINYLHNIIVWVNVTPNLKHTDLNVKMEEININYERYKSIEKIIDFKDELINLCNTLLLDIKEESLPMGQQYCLAGYIDKFTLG